MGSFQQLRSPTQHQYLPTNLSNSLPSYLASYLPSCLPGYFVNQSTFTSMALLNLTRYILPKESQHGSVEDLMR